MKPTRLSSLSHIPCLAFSLVFLVILTAGSNSAWAAVLYRQGSISGDVPGVFSNGPGSGALQGTLPERQQIANPFVLSDGGVPASVQWFGQPLVIPPDHGPETFLLRLYSDSAGKPGSLLHEEPASILGIDAGLAGLSYTSSFSPGALEAGTKYWLSILQNDVSTPSPGWLWSTFQSPGFSPVGRTGEVAPWQVASTNQGQDFTISTIPEPSTFMLVVMVGAMNLCGRGRSFPLLGRKPHGFARN